MASRRVQAIASHLAESVSGAVGAGQPHTCNLPDWDHIPAVEGMPHGSAWGLFDKGDGKKDELGTLNLLTPANTKAALDEISTGERIQLDWSLDNLTFPGFNRKPFEQKLVDLQFLGVFGSDDEVYINTQSSSQWDGFRHIAHQTSGKYYNGLTHAEIHGDEKSIRNGIHKWCEAGGIVGRGVLIDWVRWHEQTRPSTSLPSPITRHAIPLGELLATLEFQGTSVRPGDIMLVRTGFVRWHEHAGSDERKAGTKDTNQFIGLAATDEMIKWLWNSHFAAVASDTVAFEAWPPAQPMLHEWLLAQWGTPIGEMWDLEALATSCAAKNKWSFFLSSAPLHVKGGVGSPPNAIAIL